MNIVKEKLKSNKLTMGSWITLSHTAIAEIMAKFNFDWLTIDMEHSAIELSDTQKLIQIIDLAGRVPIVRVGKNESNLIKRVLDAGAQGVIVPMVNTREDAVNAVKSASYPLKGIRGVGLARAQGYGLEFEKYKRWANRNIVIVVQIEHIKAIEKLEEILTVEGVDASIIGPYDLSGSLGCPGDFKNKDLKEAIKRYLKVCAKLKKPAGIHVIPPYAHMLKARIKEGFKFIAFSLDTLFMGEKIKEEMNSIKNIIQKK